MADITETELLDARAIKRFAPVSDMAMWRWIKAGEFPRPIKISGRNYWPASEIRSWFDRKSAEREVA